MPTASIIACEDGSCLSRGWKLACSAGSNDSNDGQDCNAQAISLEAQMHAHAEAHSQAAVQAQNMVARAQAHAQAQAAAEAQAQNLALQAQNLSMQAHQLEAEASLVGSNISPPEVWQLTTFHRDSLLDREAIMRAMACCQG